MNHFVTMCAVLLAGIGGSFGATSLSQYGITWTFDGDYGTGRFCNGDYWVVGPVTVTGTSHDSASGVIDGQETSVLNPRWSYAQGYDSRDDGGRITYNSSLTVVFPAFLNPGDALVTVTHRITDREPWLADGAVLTVVDTALPADMFRPPLARPVRYAVSADDPHIFSSDDIRWNLLPSLTQPDGLPDLSQSEGKLQRPWIMHVGAIEGQRFIPANNIPNYGRDISRVLSEAAVQLACDHAVQEKRDVCIYAIQAGIDLYGCCLDSADWTANGGHHSGRKFPLVFAGIMLGNDDMLGIGRTAPREPDLSRFQEDDQTYYSDDPDLPEYTNTVTKQEDPGPADTANNVFPCRGVRGWIGRLSGGEGATALWRIDNNRRDGAAPHYEHVHITHWGDDRETGYGKADSYRRCCNVSHWIGTALLLRLMGDEAVTAWGHDAFFDYCWRWMTEDDTAVKPLWEVKYPGSTYPDRQQLYASDAFVTGMWNLHGAALPPLRTGTAIGGQMVSNGIGGAAVVRRRYRIDGSVAAGPVSATGIVIEQDVGGKVGMRLLLR